MKLVQMRSFHAVAQTGSFMAASRLLHVSQPTITAQVKDLEEAYGVELFRRHGRGVQLTEDGRALFEMTQKTMAAFQESIEFLKETTGLRAGHLRIAAVGSQQVARVLAEFHRRYPSIRITVQFANSRRVEETILEHDADVGFVGELRNLSRFHRLRFSRPEIVIVVARTHPWRNRKSIRIEELAGQPLVMREQGSETRRVLEAAARKAGVPLSPRVEIASRDGVLAAVAGAIGVGCVSEEEIGPYPVHAVRIANADMHTTVDIACLEERKTARLHRAFLEVAESCRKRS
ncbi:MAG TPA: LysR substrate-binding domain-containing protein [Burkholderiaceae bacterium]|nr:LysR substrate-binding domain-containing protein [Burkholderiaceae bacterium]